MCRLRSSKHRTRCLDFLPRQASPSPLGEWKRTSTCVTVKRCSSFCPASLHRRSPDPYTPLACRWWYTAHSTRRVGSPDAPWLRPFGRFRTKLPRVGSMLTPSVTRGRAPLLSRRLPRPAPRPVSPPWVAPPAPAGAPMLAKLLRVAGSRISLFVTCKN